MQTFLEPGTIHQGIFQIPGAYLVPSGFDLNDRSRGTGAVPYDARQADEPFLACQSNFDALAVRHDMNDRNHTAVQEVAELDRVGHFGQNGPRRQGNKFRFL